MDAALLLQRIRLLARARNPRFSRAAYAELFARNWYLTIKNDQASLVIEQTRALSDIVRQSRRQQVFLVAAMLVWYARTPVTHARYGRGNLETRSVADVGAFLHNGLVVAHSHIGGSNLQPLKAEYNALPGVLPLPIEYHSDTANAGDRPEVPTPAFQELLATLDLLLDGAVPDRAERTVLRKELQRPKYRGRLLIYEHGEYR